MKNERRKKRDAYRTRFNKMKDLMSTFAMSTVAVVAAVVLIPSSPKADITRAIPLSDEIAYQVTVTDQENALDASTLFVVLENQLEYYEAPLSLGENSGYFDALNPNTEYRLSVYGTKGFGQERLDTLKLTTREKEGGTILAVTPSTVDFSTSYTLDIVINDPDQDYTTVELFYGQQWEQDMDITYDSLLVDAPRLTLEVTDIYSTYPVHFYLKATTAEGETILDSIWVTPPFTLDTSVYLDFINNHQVGFYLYSDMDVGDSTYVMTLYRHNLEIREETITLKGGDHHGSTFVIDDLSPDQTYRVELSITYTNPQTLAEETVILYDEEITTLKTYTYTYTKDITNTTIDVTITLDDPQDYFDYLMVEITDTSGEFDTYLASETYTFITNTTDKTVTLSITIPSVPSYNIALSMHSQTTMTHIHLIDTIEVN
jgi:hypothetical protein